MGDMGIYSSNLIKSIRSELDFIESCDDGGGIAFAYQNILDMLHAVCDQTVDGKPSIVDENGGI